MKCNYQVETDTLLTEGGIIAKAVKHISEKSKLIKELLNARIRSELDKFVIKPTFFCQSIVVR